MSILFESQLSQINEYKIIKLPIDTSLQLPSRGMVMVTGTINKLNFQAPLEPDGKGSHWFVVSNQLSLELELNIGDLVSLSINVLSNWIEPIIPKDIMDSLIRENLLSEWESLTPKARWSWLRWIRSTKNLTTRLKRIEVTCSKLHKGDRRPCCFDQSKCTVTEVSKSGILL